MESKEYLVKLFDDAGFDFDHFDTVVDPERRETPALAGPSTHETREHARFIARKR